MRAIVIDTETTGVEEPIEVVQVAWTEITIDGEPGESFSSYYKPEGRISHSAMAVHHILPTDIESCPPSDSFTLPDDVGYLIGHNVDFDWRAIGSPDVKRICTLALARQTWPDADGHSLGALIYMLHGGRYRTQLRDAHNAAVDVDLTIVLLQELLERLIFVHAILDTLEDLWEISEVARVPKVMPFGKHKGTPIGQVPPDYKRWLLRQPDVDPYLVKALGGVA